MSESSEQQTWAKGKVSCKPESEYTCLNIQKYQHPEIEEDEEAHDSASNHDETVEILVQNYWLGKSRRLVQ